jgi:hypothetical protein
MSALPRRSPRFVHTLPAVLALWAGVVSARPLAAQTELEAIRTEMKAGVQRLVEIDYGMNRVVMQNPNVQSRVSLVRALVLNVQIDLDYLAAMMQLVGMAREPTSAAAVVLTELKGAQDRMLLDEFEQDVASREERGAVPSQALLIMEQQLVSELHQITALYGRTTEALDQVR